FDGLSLAEAGEEGITLQAPSRFSATLISQRFASRMRQMWSEHYGPVRDLQVRGAQDAGGVAAQPSAPKKLGQDAVVSRPAEPDRTVPTDAQQSPFDCAAPGIFARGMTLDRFCTNDTNRLARRAAAKILDESGQGVIMIHGAAGRGKTHLLNAVGQEWLRRNPNDNVLYLTYDSLMTDVSEAFISKSVKELRTFLQNTDVLLIDDIQLLRGRKRTQEELDCLIDKLRGAGKRVLVAGALPPTKLAETGISSRLAGRLGGGLCVQVNKPDLDLRLKIASQLADEASAISGVSILRRHLEFIARRCEDSVRELEGLLSLVQVATEAEADIGKELSDDRLRQLLSEHLNNRRPSLTPEAIFDYTTEVFGLSKTDLLGRSRKQPIVRGRHAFCLAVRKLTDTPLTAIGAMIGRDHTTVMHSIKTAEILAESDTTFGARITQIFDEFDHNS
ncbi:MAG: DnaA/Hda family protein, partial [Pseudomonadota bacterium]